MKVKICGIVSEEIAQQAIVYGADALGFVFAVSKRRISTEKAKKIIKGLPINVWKVGVFVDEPIESLLLIAKEVGLTHVQLHGDESKNYCAEITSHGFEVIKAIQMKSEKDINLIYEYDDDYILVDSPRGKYHGGNGTSFDWTLLQEMQRKHPKLILAGGLTAENVKVAISQCAPFMVDVSSGVEIDGKKSPSKIRRFIEATN